MANYANLLAQIAANIYSNNNQDITGDGLQLQLNAMVASLGAGYQFMGVAHPADTPSGYADLRAFWLAGEVGTYTNFGGLVLADGEVAVIKYDGNGWSKAVTGAASAAQVTELENVLDVDGNGDRVLSRGADNASYINYQSGAISSSASNRSTNGIDVSEYRGKTIQYLQNVYMVSSGTVGMAFYDSNDTFISGVPCHFGGSADGVEETTAVVPNNATYARFTIYKDYADAFYVKVLGDYHSVRLDNLENQVTANSQKLANITTWQSSVTSGQYVTAAGALVSQELYSVARGTLKAGQMIKIVARGYLTGVAMISVQSGNTYEVKVISIDSTTQPYYWTNDTANDVQIAVSYETQYGLAAYVEDFGFSNALKQIHMFISSWTGFAVTSGQYVHANGFVASSSPFSVARGTLKAGQTIAIVARGYLTSVAMISVQSGNSYDVKVISIDSTTRLYCWANTTSSDVQIAVSYETQYGLTANILYTGVNNGDSINWNPIAAFNNLVCVGDSLTFSQVYTSSSASRQAYRPYPQILSKLCGNEYEILAAAGATAKSCWDSFGAQVVAKDNPLAIIYLGTNGGVSDTLDTDVVGDNPNSWADNNVGCYCRFVQKFKSLGYKVLLLKIWTTSGTGSSDLANTNSAIDHIASRFGCAVMDVPVTSDAQYHYWPDLSGSNSVHYNDLGYAWFASQLAEKIGALSSNQIRLLIPNA